MLPGHFVTILVITKPVCCSAKLLLVSLIPQSVSDLWRPMKK